MVIFSSVFDHFTGCKVYYGTSFIHCLNRDTSHPCYVSGTLLRQLGKHKDEHLFSGSIQGHRETEGHKDGFLKLWGVCSDRDLHRDC